MTIEAILPDVARTAFGEVQVAELAPVTGWSFAYNVNPDMVKTTVSGGTVTASAGQAVLSTGAATNQSAQIETIRPLRYINGVGGVVRFTAVFTPGVAGSEQIIGLGDGTDGLYFGYNGEQFGIVRMSNGTSYWEYVGQWTERNRSFAEDWLDTTKGNVFQILYQWLGYGAIFWFLEETGSGRFDLLHKIEYANRFAETSLRNPTLPLMARVKNTSNASDVVLKTPSGMGGIHGKLFAPEPIHPFTFYRTLSGSRSSITSERNVITLQNPTTFQSVTNRIRSRLTALSFYGAGSGLSSMTIQGKTNATLGGSPSYSAYNADTSPITYDTAGTTVTGGQLRFSFEHAQNEGHIVDLSPFGIELGPGDTFTISVNSSISTAASVGVTWVDLF